MGLPRFGVFNVVGLAGFLVQLTALAILTRGFGWHYAAATALAIELAVLHNIDSRSRDSDHVGWSVDWPVTHGSPPKSRSSSMPVTKRTMRSEGFCAAHVCRSAGAHRRRTRADSSSV